MKPFSKKQLSDKHQACSTNRTRKLSSQYPKKELSVSSALLGELRRQGDGIKLLITPKSQRDGMVQK